MTAIKKQWTSRQIQAVQVLICLIILTETQQTWTQMVTSNVSSVIQNETI